MVTGNKNRWNFHYKVFSSAGNSTWRNKGNTARFICFLITISSCKPISVAPSAFRGHCTGLAYSQHQGWQFYTCVVVTVRTIQWSFGSHKMSGIPSRLIKELLSSHEDICSMKWFGWLFGYLCGRNWVSELNFKCRASHFYTINWGRRISRFVWFRWERLWIKVNWR